VDGRIEQFFRRLIAHKGVKPRIYTRHIDAMAAVDLMAAIDRLIGQIAAMSRRGVIPASDAEVMVKELAECYMDPLGSAARVVLMENDLRKREGPEKP
jgi:hypothetical protein